MNQPSIVAYLKPTCGWSNGVRAIMRKYNLNYVDKDIINFPENRIEMIQKSGQQLSPCVEVNGVMLADISGEELEVWMIQNKIVSPSDTPADAPINQACAHEMPVSHPVSFKG